MGGHVHGDALQVVAVAWQDWKEGGIPKPAVVIPGETFSPRFRLQGSWIWGIWRLKLL